MASPGVIRKTEDVSTRVAGFAGVYTAIVVPAKKGPIDAPQLMTSDTAFLKKYTPDETVKVGYDVSHFSALMSLERTDKLWVMRAQNAALYGGAGISPSTISRDHTKNVTGLADPTAYTFVEVVETASAETATIATVADVGGSLAGVSFLLPGQAEYIWIEVTGFTSEDPKHVSKTGHKVTIAADETDAAIAIAIQLVITGLAGFTSAAPVDNLITAVTVAEAPMLDAADVDSTFTILTTVQGKAAITIEECFMLYGADPGAWNNDLRFKITNYADFPDVVKVSGAFILDIYKSANTSVVVESFLLSRVQGAKDDAGRNIYLEDRLEASEYVRAFDNTTVADSVLPATNQSVIELAAGSDGSAVSDSHMLTALKKFENPDDIPVTVIQDGGWATVAYQQDIDRIAQLRGDCAGLLSIPYAKESAASYLNEVVDYRRNILNLSSSFCGLYTGWIKIFDRFNDRNLYIAPDAAVSGAISFSAQNQEIWYPPAGFRRGVVRALDVRRRYDKGERDYLYDNDVNALRFVPGKGIVIFGQKTLLGKPSALDRMNVRLLLVVIQPAIAEAYEDFEFEFNDVETRNSVKGIVDEYMEGIKASRGVIDYLAVCDETNNTSAVIDGNEMVLDLYIKPSKSAEFLTFRTIITPTGVNFTELVTAA